MYDIISTAQATGTVVRLVESNQIQVSGNIDSPEASALIEVIKSDKRSVVDCLKQRHNTLEPSPEVKVPDRISHTHPVDAYGDELVHRKKYRLGEITAIALKTRYGWAMKVEAHDGSEYWLNLDGGWLTTAGHRVGRINELLPIGDVIVGDWAYTRHEAPSTTLEELLEHDTYWASAAEQMAVHSND